MATLTNTKIKDTYDGLLKTTTNDVIGASGVTLIEDGLGNASAISIGRANNGVTITGAVTATSIVKSGGTSSQFLKADGSIDSNTYLTSESDTLDSVTDRGASTTNAITVGGLTASGLSYPSTDGTSGQVIGTDGAGNLSFIDGGAGTTPTLDQVTAAGATSSRDIVVNGVTIGRGNTAGNSSNTALGNSALSAVTGSNNTGVGASALQFVTSGFSNTAVGTGSLDANTTGSDNTAVGTGALTNSTTGGQNTVIGSGAGDAISTNSRNVFVGDNAARFLDGGDNVAIGQAVANYVTVAGGGGDKTSGTQNVYVGTGIYSGAAYTINEMVFGYGATGNGSNTATYGNSSITSHIFPSGNVSVNGATLTGGKFSIKTSSAVSYNAASYNNLNLRFESGGSPTTNTITGLAMGVGGNAEVMIGAVQNASGYADMVFQGFAGAYSERMRIDSSGNVGIGEQSPFSGMGAGYRGIEINGTYPIVKFSNGATDFSTFEADANATYITSIGARYLAMFTNGSEKMRIGSGGDILIGKQTYNVNVNGIEFNDAANYARMTNSVPSGVGNNCYHVYNTSIPTYVFYVQANGGIANYQANNVNLSDERVKTDIKPLSSYWDKFKALELVTFKYTNQDHNDNNIGLIAQQVESVAPEFVSNDGFAYTSDDEEPLKAIYTTDLYHASMKVLQEAMQKIETLEAKVATLESQLNA